MSPMDLSRIDDLIKSGGRFAPRWGWHDDHRHEDGTAKYLPALMQVRSEYAGLIAVLDAQAPTGYGAMFSGRCLQLGLGECNASHEAWRLLFDGGAVTIDRGSCLVDDRVFTGGNTHDPEVQDFAMTCGPYDFLFIDAGHDFEDAKRDHEDYGPMVRKGGIIAFHDSLYRHEYPEVKVWRYLNTLGDKVHYIGTEVGIAWVVKE